MFATLAPDAFADRFGRWVAAACETTGLTHIAIDGKNAITNAVIARAGSMLFPLGAVARAGLDLLGNAEQLLAGARGMVSDMVGAV